MCYLFVIVLQRRAAPVLAFLRLDSSATGTILRRITNHLLCVWGSFLFSMIVECTPPPTHARTYTHTCATHTCARQLTLPLSPSCPAPPFLPLPLTNPPRIGSRSVVFPKREWPTVVVLMLCVAAHMEPLVQERLLRPSAGTSTAPLAQVCASLNVDACRVQHLLTHFRLAIRDGQIVQLN